MSEKQDKVLELLGELIAGLSVPLSLSYEIENFLGAARDPLVAIRDELYIKGYPKHEEVTEILRAFFDEQNCQKQS